MKKLKPVGIRRSHSGAALIIVLAFVVLLSGLIIAYLSLSTTERQLANNSFTGAKADQLANSALDTVVGDLKQEIVNGSTALTGNAGNTTNYVPLNAINIVPSLSGGNPTSMANLVRISKYQDVTGTPTTTAPLVGSRASNLASTTTSANGRSVSVKRWNKHYLLPRVTANVGSATFDSTPVATFIPPDWVFVTTQGPKDITGATSSTLNSVIGRYSYAIYDEGGTLNLNAAGYPASGVATSQTSGKGNIAYADLTQLTNGAPSVTSAQMTKVVNNLVGWRNYASAQPGGNFTSGFSFTATSATNYFNAVATNQASGFMQTATATPPYNNRTDQAFLSRQQLIDFWTAQGFPPDLLQFVGTFSRDANAPTWSPLQNASALGGSSTTAYNYKSNADNTTTPPINPDFLNWRFSTATTLTSYDINGNSTSVSVNAGDPIVRKRFNLSRINWLTYQGPNPAVTNAAAAIKQYFGLVWSTDSSGYACWVYTSPTGSTASPPTSIMTLSQVAAANREPDFFELLQAGILAGSLGLDAGVVGTSSTSGPAGDTQKWDQTTAYQVLQIGANIIDQYDTDSYPTEIAANFNLGTAPGSAAVPPVLGSVYGIENLPYLYAIYLAIFRYDSNHKNVGAWFIPEIWNPHQQPIVASTGAAPTSFRFVASGLATMLIRVSGPNQPVPNLPPINGPTTTLDSDPGVAFTSSTTALEPTLLDQSNATASSTNDNIKTAQMTFTVGIAGTTQYTTNTHNHLGLFVGSVLDNDPLETDTSIIHYTDGFLTPNADTFFLQYKDASNNWRTYTEMKGLNNAPHSGSYADVFNNNGASYIAMRSDPRTDRFSVNEVFEGDGAGSGTSNGFGIPNKTSWSSVTATGDAYTYYTPSNLTHFFLAGSGLVSPPVNSNCNPWQLCENRNPPSLSGSQLGTEYYTDLDGINRRADGAYGVRFGKEGHPLATGNTPSRPVILNRAFRNVGELGYAFRDLPWKNIDFFTPESADTGLLDLFTVDDVNTIPMTAGRVSLNTRQAPVLASLLSGATEIEPITTATTTSISAADAETLASLITTSSGTTPFVSRAELVSRFKSATETDTRFSSLTSLPLTTANPNPNSIKAQRESIVRALSEATTTRTWNLMIDVVAQTGHYPPGSNALSQFVVDGERRYWLHIAIDRFTGEVLDRVLEPVYE